MSVTLKDVSGNALNLSTSQVSGCIKNRYSDISGMADLGATVLDAPNGVVSLSIPYTITADLPVTIGVYDVEVKNTGDDTVTKVLAGKAAIYPEVTT